MYRSSIPCPHIPLSNASRAPSRPPSHGLGPGWFAKPYPYDFCHHCFMPVYPDAIPPSLLTPRSSLPLHLLPQGSWGFYVRAEHASSPPHAPDMLTVRIQVIDGTRTFTLSDPQPCRLLPSTYRP